MSTLRSLIGGLFTILMLAGFLVAQDAADDSDKLRRFEIGGQFTFLNRADANTVEAQLRELGWTSSPYRPRKIGEFGFGGRFTVNLTKRLGLEAEANYFPIDKRAPFIIGVPIDVKEPGGRKFQMFFGPKIGVRKRKFGVFAKARPGFLTMDRYEYVQSVGTTADPFILSTVRRGTFLNLDLGGVFEYYPTRRTLLRVDAGDTIIRYGAFEPKSLNAPFTRHNLQLSVGFGFRF